MQRSAEQVYTDTSKVVKGSHSRNVYTHVQKMFKQAYKHKNINQHNIEQVKDHL